MLEIDYWLNRFERGTISTGLNEFCFYPPFTLATDASSSGLGAVLYKKGKVDESSANIPSVFKEESSACRELLAVKMAFETWKSSLSGSVVKLRVDNQAVASILERGSTVPLLHRICYQILGIILQHNIKLLIRWVPR